MGRKRAIGWRGRVAATVVLAALVGSAWTWWVARHWAPTRSEFPVQGVIVGAEDGETDFKALRAIGADFAYLEASSGDTSRDPAFARNLREVRGTGLRFGAVHTYDPCVPADRQAANFVTIVPRDAALLPPVISLSSLTEGCHDPVSEAGVESELTTFLNQVEAHTGQPAVLKIGPEFEDHYHIAARLERGLWLERDWMQPDYAGRPWTLWTANSSLRTEAGSTPFRWVVLQP
ncbi:glycoside hydrolase family 25 protein [Altererythrobacter sp. Root672]|uniref:glycoside hydrolase family 25 protein n=1 Tax=Altererythrobacter sp. Root672 TaxID=1736584 RepID=UPI0006FEE01D|nr:glycoside hydrolase family 25 protein [Altererythrobacter sp. Root672]KRA81311.1 lysozyme [Altererythrobacter sp. Root672]